jgi:hypothetical protein
MKRFSASLKKKLKINGMHIKHFRQLFCGFISFRKFILRHSILVHYVLLLFVA